MIIISISAQENEPKIILQSAKSIFEIKQKSIYHIDFILDKQGDSINYLKRQIGGKLISSSLNEIQLTPSIEIISINNGSGLNSSTVTNYMQPAAAISIDNTKISEIYLQTYASNSCENAGGVLTIIGVFTAAVIAPLASINYQTGEMNSHVFYTCAAVGIGICAISIPLFSFSVSKRFVIKPGYCETKRLWKIVD